MKRQIVEAHLRKEEYDSWNDQGLDYITENPEDIVRLFDVKKGKDLNMTCKVNLFGMDDESEDEMVPWDQVWKHPGDGGDSERRPSKRN